MPRGKFIIPQWMLATFAPVITASVVSFLMAGPVDAKSYSNITADQQVNAEPDGTWTETRGQIDHRRRIFTGEGECPVDREVPQLRLLVANGNVLTGEVKSGVPKSSKQILGIAPYSLLAVTDSLLSSVGSPAGLVFDLPAGPSTSSGPIRSMFWDLSVDSISGFEIIEGACGFNMSLSGNNQGDDTPVDVRLGGTVTPGLPLTTGVDKANNILLDRVVIKIGGLPVGSLTPGAGIPGGADVFESCGTINDGVIEPGGDITTVPVPLPLTCLKKKAEKK